MNTRSKTAKEIFHHWKILSPEKEKIKFDYNSAIEHLKRNYINPKSGVSFSGISKIYKFYNNVIPIKDIKKFLRSNNAYTLHAKSFKKQYNPSFIKYKGQQFQLDLIDVNNLSQKNNGIKFLLTVICSFTKKAWINTLKSKKSGEVLNAFQKILKESGKKPHSILTDSGGEFSLVIKWCLKNNIKTYLPYSSFHGAIIERFNQSIKNRIYNWMDQYKTEKYSPHLQDILIGYNNSYHSSIGVSPNVAWNNKSTHPQIREKLQTYFSKFSRKHPKLKIGDIVRIRLLSKSAFTKGYDIQNNQELFKINNISLNLPIPMYEIKSLENPEEGVLRGKFYGNELIKVEINNENNKFKEIV